MGLKNWLFGKDKKSKTSKEAEAIQLLKKQLNTLEVEGKNLIRKAEEQKQVAKSMLRSGNRIGAKQALTRSSLYMQKYNQNQNMSLNLSSQIDTIASAKSTSETVSALKVGSTVVDDTLTKLSAIDVERTMAEMEEQRDKINMMNESLSDVSSLEMDLDEEFMDSIDDQLASLEIEMQSESHGDLPSAGINTVEPVIEEEKKVEKTLKENNDLTDELKSMKKELEGSE